MRHIVRIEKIIAGGSGLARTAAGQVILSGFALPGELTELREVRRKSGHIEAELAQVLEPSAERVPPRCPLYGDCGGCDLQHGSYAEQLRIKQAIVAETMQRAHVPLPADGVEDVLPSPQQWGYRHRLRLKISPDGQLGFFKKRSNEFVAVNCCLTAAAGINAAVAELASSRCLRGRADEAELLQSPADGQITLVLPLREKQQLSAESLRQITACASIAHIGGNAGKAFQPLYSRDKSAPLAQEITLPKLGKSCVLSWSGGCFSQVNPGQNARLTALALDIAGDVRGRSVLDLYCGMGNFSVPLALAGAAVTGIEGSPESVRWAQRNAETAGVVARFSAADVSDSLRRLVKKQQQTDIILLDPPRAGIGPAAALLPELHAERIVYISCDPATLARDLRSLCGSGYALRRLIPVDMFPQTHHIETAALLAKSR
ncbi:MAG: class I SAM-dependent RNA methyltransferase [Candidatus Electronema sp. V4]|uniref:class I SAM-dependent RNA methyltransferase n=1 Tax=Candidatus Electronema sp. V4 TaxID=3454756 RepID=UPI0040558270